MEVSVIDAKTAALWFVRMAMLQLGAVMTARGIGDEATWQAVTGGALALGTMTWSWVATRKQIAQPPPGVPPIVDEIERRARDLLQAEPPPQLREAVDVAKVVANEVRLMRDELAQLRGRS